MAAAPGETSFIQNTVVPRLIYFKYPGRVYKNGMSCVPKNFQFTSRNVKYFDLDLTIHRLSFMLVYEDKSDKPFHIIVKMVPTITPDTALVPKYNAILNEIMMATAGMSIFGKHRFPTYFVDDLYEFEDYTMIITSNPTKEGYYCIANDRLNDDQIRRLAKFLANYHVKNYFLRTDPIYIALCKWIDEHPSDPELVVLGDNLQKYIDEHPSMTIQLNTKQDNFYFRSEEVDDDLDIRVLNWHTVKLGTAYNDLLNCYPIIGNVPHFNNFIEKYMKATVDHLESSHHDDKEIIDKFYKYLDDITFGIAFGLREIVNIPDPPAPKKKSKKKSRRR